MSTEFLHALYDGGGGAGFRDYWDLMSRNPRNGGGFFWALVDEGVVRTDQDGRIDTVPNLAPDGLVGPHREKEGSFYTIKEIWSPVGLAFGADGQLQLKNRFSFTNLNQCQIEWKVLAVAGPGAVSAVAAAGTLAGPDVAPGASGALALGNVGAAGDILQVTARDPDGREIWTWSRALRALVPESVTRPAPPAVAANLPVRAQISLRQMPGSGPGRPAQRIVSGADWEYRFDGDTLRLVSATRRGRTISLANGPRFFALLRNPPARGGSTPPTTTFHDVLRPTLPAGQELEITQGGDVTNYLGEVTLSTSLSQQPPGYTFEFTWRINTAGDLALDYVCDYDGEVDMMGVAFDYPQANVTGLQWLGWGPFRSWRNRLEGTTLGVWKNTPKDHQPGVAWNYPEFEGYFRGWRWAVFDTTEGQISISNGGATPDDSYLGVFTPRDGPVVPLLELPETGLAFLDVIPAMRDKFKLLHQLGPQAEPVKVSGGRTGRIVFQFE